LEQILSEVKSYAPKFVCVTGGEPLAQSNCIELLEALVELGYEVSLETSGAMDLGQVPNAVTKVMDLKPPGSGELKANRFDNILHLKPSDQVKFVLQDRADYEWAKAQIALHSLEQRAEILFSPVAGKMEPVELANWILEDRLPVRFQIQLHKYLWGNQQGV
jgi:7-carboxy-7-deazaguanine synthase